MWYLRYPKLCFRKNRLLLKHVLETAKFRDFLYSDIGGSQKCFQVH